MSCLAGSTRPYSFLVRHPGQASLGSASRDPEEGVARERGTIVVLRTALCAYSRIGDAARAPSGMTELSQLHARAKKLWFRPKYSYTTSAASLRERKYRLCQEELRRQV
jgi:hypothetical protein